MFVVQGGVLDMSCYMYIEEKNSLQVYATTAYRIIKNVHCSIYYQHSDNSKFKARVPTSFGSLGSFGPPFPGN